MLKFQPLSFAKTRMLQPQPKMFVRLPLRVMVLNEPLIRSPHHAASGWKQRLAEATMSWVSDCYYAGFGNFPPVLYWRGTVKGFQALMVQALERGTPLTADELMKVQGHSEPPPEAKT